MSTQPDAFEKAVDKIIEQDNVVDCQYGYISKAEAVMLLKSHHRKVVRMVKQVSEAYSTNDPLEPSAAENLRDDILAKLKAMEGGT